MAKKIWVSTKPGLRLKKLGLTERYFTDEPEEVEMSVEVIRRLHQGNLIEREAPEPSEKSKKTANSGSKE